MSVIPFLPTWPKVRCDKCHHVYSMPDPDQHGVRFVKGDCPRCHHERFSSSIPTNIAPDESGGSQGRAG